jgi:hypothetical protein
MGSPTAFRLKARCFSMVALTVSMMNPMLPSLQMGSDWS